MQTLNESHAAAVSGGGKPDLVNPYPVDHDRPVPIWHPLFPVDP